jgi:quinol monooxygenase YgiN
MNTPVYEVAVYSVKEDLLERFLKLQPAAHDAIRQFPGFRSLRTLRSADAPATFVDYCEWDSLEDAQQANQRAATMPELQIFFELGDGMVSFGHYTTGLFTEKNGQS